MTTGMVADLFGVVPRTISKWVDSGKLKGYKLPGSMDRRIPRQAIVDFCRAENVPVPKMLQVNFMVLVVGGFKFPVPTTPAELRAVRYAVDAIPIVTDTKYMTQLIVSEYFPLDETAALCRHVGEWNPAPVILAGPEKKTSRIGGAILSHSAAVDWKKTVQDLVMRK